VFLNTDLADDSAPGDPARDKYSDDDWQVLHAGQPPPALGRRLPRPGRAFDDAGLVGVQSASVRGAGGSYTLEVRLPLVTSRARGDRSAASGSTSR
jgi:hypothetical protein